MKELIGLVPQFAVAIAIIAAAVILTRFILGWKNVTAIAEKNEEKNGHKALLGKVEALVSRPPPPPDGCSPAECQDKFEAINERLAAHSEKFERLQETDRQTIAVLETHGKMHRKSYRAVADLKEGQNIILDHLTNGGDPSTRRHEDINYDIDLEKTGEVSVPDGLADDYKKRNGEDK